MSPQVCALLVDATTETLLMVGVSGTIATLLGLPLGHFWNFDFGLGAISVVEIRAGRAVMRSLNLDSHLGAETGPPAGESSERDRSGAL